MKAKRIAGSSAAAAYGPHQQGRSRRHRSAARKSADPNARNARSLQRTRRAGQFHSRRRREIPPIHVAAKANQPEVVGALLAAGVTIPKLAGRGRRHRQLMSTPPATHRESSRSCIRSTPTSKAVTENGTSIIHSTRVYGVRQRRGTNLRSGNVIRFPAERCGAPRRDAAIATWIASPIEKCGRRSRPIRRYRI